MPYGDELNIDFANSLPFKVGDSFIYIKEPAQKRQTPFEGELLTVVGFKGQRYKNRMVLRRPSGELVLFPLNPTIECFERARNQA
jgi:hypothetical protein